MRTKILSWTFGSHQSNQRFWLAWECVWSTCHPGVMDGGSQSEHTAHQSTSGEGARGFIRGSWRLTPTGVLGALWGKGRGMGGGGKSRVSCRGKILPWPPPPPDLPDLWTEEQKNQQCSPLKLSPSLFLFLYAPFSRGPHESCMQHMPSNTHTHTLHILLSPLFSTACLSDKA